MLKKVTILMSVLLIVGLLGACVNDADTGSEEALGEVSNVENTEMVEDDLGDKSQVEDEIDSGQADDMSDEVDEADEIVVSESNQEMDTDDSETTGVVVEAVVDETDYMEEESISEVTEESETSEEPEQVEEVVEEEPEEVEVEEIEEVVDLGITLHFIGRSSVRLDLSDGRVIYIDPAEGDASMYNVPADLVLVTHQHGDHNQTGLVTMKDGGAIIQCPTDIRSGQSATFGDIDILAVSAYNANHQASACCGFIMTIEDTVIYHSGDTSMTDEMASLAAYNIDYAMICMDGYYNMGPEEALEVANAIQADYVIPIHTSANGLVDQSNIDAFDYSNKIVIPLGGSLELN